MKLGLWVWSLLGIVLLVQCRTPNQKPQSGTKVTSLQWTGPSSIAVERCEEFRVTAVTLSGEPLPLPLQVSLSLVGSADFFSNPGCTLPISSATLAAGGKEVSVYLRARRGEMLHLSFVPLGGPPLEVEVRAVAPSELSFTETELVLPPSTVGEPLIFGIDLSNLGKGTARNLTLIGPISPFDFSGGFYPGTGGTCSQKLLDGEQCRFFLVVTPETPGEFSTPFRIGYEDDEGTGEVALLLKGIALETAQ